MLRSMLKVFLFLGCFSMLAACGGDDGGGGGERMSILIDCPADSDAAQTAGQAVYMNNCSACHAGFASAGGRGVTPSAATTVCSDLATIGDCMYDRANEGSMPPAPAGDLSDADVDNLLIWLSCNQ
jgi:mono/diheme cytochrome c family protein